MRGAPCGRLRHARVLPGRLSRSAGRSETAARRRAHLRGPRAETTREAGTADRSTCVPPAVGLVRIVNGSPLRRAEHCGDGAGELSPGAGFAFELLAAGCGQLVVLRAAVVLGGAPACLDPATPFQTMERGIQRALLDAQDIRRNLLQPFRDGPAVLWLERERAEDQEVERALRQVHAFVGHCVSPIASTKDTLTSVEVQGEDAEWRTRAITGWHSAARTKSAVLAVSVGPRPCD